MPPNSPHPAAPPAGQEPAGRKVSVLIVVGTRPEAIKLIPIILALRDSERFRPIVVTTGQHDLMVREVFKLAGVWADVNLWIGDTRAPERARGVRDAALRGFLPSVVPRGGDRTSDARGRAAGPLPGRRARAWR